MDISSRRYALAAVAVFATEVTIALFVEDRLIRPLLGDTLAVILLYLILRAVTRLHMWAAVSLSLGVACIIELGQLLRVADLLGLSGNRLLRVVLGTEFDPLDLVAYLAGGACILAAEKLWRSSAGQPRSRRLP